MTLQFCVADHCCISISDQTRYTRQTCNTNAGDLDEAVQALKATTGGTDSPRNIDSNPQHASGALTDDDLKPAFMRRLTSDKLQPDGTVTTEEAQLMGTLQARQGGELDVNPRPVSRRRLDRAAIARKAAATAVLKVQLLLVCQFLLALLCCKLFSVKLCMALLDSLQGRIPAVADVCASLPW